MTCYHPIKAVLPLQPDENGKKHVIISPVKIGKLRRSSIIKTYDINDLSELPKTWSFPCYTDNYKNMNYIDINLPCGKCLGCKLDYARRWTVRATHEAYMHDFYRNNAFVTLTFNNYALGNRRNPLSVDKTEISQFIKRLRERVRQEYGVYFRFMCCGEYGSKKGRPHYHILIFGFDFPDKQVITSIPGLTPRKLSDGRVATYYRSSFLEKNWKPAGSEKGYGFSVISEVSFESCAYTCRYILKKNTKELKPNQAQEFLLTSRMPGLGYSYLEKYYKTIFNNRMVDFGDHRISDIPRYYVDKLKVIDENMYNCYKLDTLNYLIDNLDVDNLDMTSERLLAREELKKYCLDKLHRRYEFDGNLHNI